LKWEGTASKIALQLVTSCTQQSVYGISFESVGYFHEKQFEHLDQQYYYSHMNFFQGGATLAIFST